MNTMLGAVIDTVAIDTGVIDTGAIDTGAIDEVAVPSHGELVPAVTLPRRFLGFGRFRVEVDGRPARLPPIAATVLARLLLARGGSVDAEQLYRDAWPGPEVIIKRDQRVAVHKRIAELRSILDPDGPAHGRALLLTERSARTCYRLAPDPHQVDLYRFEDLVSWVDAADDATAVGLLTQALALWTQRPLRGLPDRPFVREAVARLVALRDRACHELMVRCRALGRWRDGLAVLDRLLASQPDDIDLHRLVEQLRREGAEPSDRPTATFTLPGAPVTLPPLWNVPLRMTDLVPRPGLIARVREQLAGGPVALVGIPGVGKSRVAIEYAHQLAPCYQVTWWLDAQRADLIGDQLRELATQAGLVDPASDVPTAVVAVRRFLRTVPSGSALLIYDNAADAEQVRPWLPDSGQVLITSRSPGWAETATVVVVDTFRRDESVGMLRGRLPSLSTADAERLAVELGDLPLALAQAALLMAEQGMPASAYLAELSAHAATVTDRGQVTSYPTTLAAEMLRCTARLGSIDAGAAELLRRCALLAHVASQPISTEQLCPSTDGDVSSAADDLDACAQLHRRLGLIAHLGLARVGAGKVWLNGLIGAILRDQGPTSRSEVDV